MSIRIQKSKCVGCGRCIEACPGNLIKKDKEGKAFIRQVRDCWGCTSCIKECSCDAIRFFLGADVGGRNAHSPTMAKHATMADYRRATGFEALMGYLYLKDDFSRIIELVRAGIGEDKI